MIVTEFFVKYVSFEVFWYEDSNFTCNEVQNLNEIGLNEIDASLNEINIFTQ